MSDKCRSCGAPIRWAVTPGGKRMPLDAEPVADGNLSLVGDVARPLTLGEALLGQDDVRYKSHFATCPNAKQHRRKS